MLNSKGQSLFAMVRAEVNRDFPRSQGLAFEPAAPMPTHMTAQRAANEKQQQAKTSCG
jgi:hypothetical protein